jgi:hypothetical protein
VQPPTSTAELVSAGPITEAEIQRMGLEMPDTVQMFQFLCGLDALPLEGVKRFSADLTTLFWPNDPVQADATSILANWARQRIAELEGRAQVRMRPDGVLLLAATPQVWRRPRKPRKRQPPSNWRQIPPYWSE